jgi:hypothetical protein
MSAIAKNWKTLALIAAGLLLAVAWLRVVVGPTSEAVAAPASQTQAAAPAPAVPQGEPISNEIRDFPQLD